MGGARTEHDDRRARVRGPHPAGADPELNVFTIQATALQQAQEIRLRAPFGSSILVNVLGTSYSTAPITTTVKLWNGSDYVDPGNETSDANVEALRRATLWNFPQATALQIGPGIAWHGSVLAPGAAMRFDNGQLNGTVVVGALAGTGETHLHPPTEICLPEIDPTPPDPPDPEPPDPPDPTPEPPDPTPEPPVPTPTPTPEEPATPSVPAGEIPSFSAPSTDAPDASGQLPGTSDRTEVAIEKQVLTPSGRRVDLRHARPGQLVRFRVHAYNLGFASVQDTGVCDRVPAGLELVRAPGGPTRRGAQLCWDLGTMSTQREGTVTFRVRSTVCGRVVNRAAVRSTNGGRASDAAQVSACRAAAAPQVTG